MSPDRAMERWPDERLLAAASTGDEQAFVIFCGRTLPSLCRYAEYHCRQHDVPADLANDFIHDAILRGRDHIQRCKRDPSKRLPKVTPAWLRSIVVNLIKDWRRKNGRMISLDTTSALQVETRREREDRDEILEFFNWLRPAERDLLEMILLKGVSATQAGEQLGHSQAYAYKIYERGLRSLRDLLSEHGSRSPHVGVR